MNFLLFFLFPILMGSNSSNPIEPHSPAIQQSISCDPSTGFRCFFMGHSFFSPIATSMDGHAQRAGFDDHVQSNYFRGGTSGTPGRLWDNLQTRADIQAELDTGNFDLVGMTFHSDHPNIEGYFNWVDYALQQNASTRFFVGMPWVRYPGSNSAADMEADFSYKLEQMVYPIIDTLRKSYPGTDFYCIPYGLSSMKLKALHEAGTLDVTNLIGPPNSSLYRDSLGHAGDILKMLAGLVWLDAIYQVDLDTFSFDPGYTNDLKAIAKEIMDLHDPCYNCDQEGCDSVSTNLETLQEQRYQVQVFPNPSHGEVHFAIANPSSFSPLLELSILDLKGRTLITQTLHGTDRLEVQDLVAGMYVYSLKEEGRVVASGKFVVQ